MAQFEKTKTNAHLINLLLNAWRTMHNFAVNVQLLVENSYKIIWFDNTSSSSPSLAASHDYKMNRFCFKCEKRQAAKWGNKNICWYNILTHYKNNSNRKIREIFVVLHKYQSNFNLKTTVFFGCRLTGKMNHLIGILNITTIFLLGNAFYATVFTILYMLALSMGLVR